MAQANSLVAELPHLGVLEFSGADAEDFLHGQLSCDVKGTPAGSATWGSYCTAKGRMLADFLLWRGEPGFAMLLPRELIAPMHKRLSMFVLRSKVTIADASSRLAVLGCAGDRAAEALRPSFARLPAKPGEMVRDSTGDALLMIAAARFLLVVSAERAQALLDGLPQSLQRVDARVWRWLDIRGGIPWITAATQEQFVPQMANLDLIGGISFTKGCYPGQEIVARTHYRGQLKRRMFLANVAGAAAAGDPLYSDDLGDQASGMVVNAEVSPDGGSDVLAVAQIASRESSVVHLGSLTGPALRFLSLPYDVA